MTHFISAGEFGKSIVIFAIVQGAGDRRTSCSPSKGRAFAGARPLRLAARKELSGLTPKRSAFAQYYGLL
jgi:hypothetical protein